jgi:hypothetical protein
MYSYRLQINYEFKRKLIVVSLPKYGDLAPGCGSLKNWTIKYGLEPRTRTSSNSKLQTRPLVTEGATK